LTFPAFPNDVDLDLPFERLFEALESFSIYPHPQNAVTYLSL
jgi:hypothetical protein